MRTLKRSAIPNYQDEIQRAINLEQLIVNFFDNLSQLQINDIANFLSNLSKRSDGKIPDSNLPNLLTKINQLIQQNQKSSIAEIAIILNSLASLGYKKSDLPNLDFGAIIQVFNSQENENLKTTINLLSGFARLGYDKDELNISSGKLLGATNLKYLEFQTISSAQKINLLNSLTKIGYDKKNHEIQLLALKIFNEVKKEIHNLDSKYVAALFHSCAKIAIYEEIFSVREEILSALTPEKIAGLSSQSAFSLLQAQMFCELEYKQSFLDQNLLEQIKARYIPKTANISKLQQSVADALAGIGYEVEQEKSVYQVAQASVRDIDIIATKTVNGERVQYFIEVDGASHYLQNSAQIEIDSATKKRNLINKAAISLRTDSIAKSYYLKLSFTEIEAAKKSGKFDELLQTKLNEAEEITIEAYKNYLESETTSTNSSEEIITSETIKLKAEEVDSKISPSPTSSGKKGSDGGKKKKTTKATASKISQKYEFPTITAFEAAINQTSLEEIENRIRSGDDVNQILSSGKSAFDLILECIIKPKISPELYQNYSKILNILIEAGADTKELKILKSQNPSIAQSLYQHSLIQNQEVLACALIKSGSLSPETYELCRAVESNSPRIVDAVIEQDGFDPNSRDAISAINLAANNLIAGRCDIRILANLINKTNISSTLTCNFAALLMSLIKNDCPDIFTKLLKQRDPTEAKKYIFSDDLDDLESEDYTIIHYAATFGNAEIIRFLTTEENSYGVDVGRILGPRTPLIVAIDCGHLEIVKILIEEKGIDPNQLSKIGFTPIARAAQTRNQEMVSYLIERGAGTNLGMTLKEFTEKFSSALKEYGIAPTTLPNPIVQASIAGDSKMIRFLVEQGFSTETDTVNGKTSIVNSSIIYGKASFLSALIDADLDVIEEQSCPEMERGVVKPIQLAIHISGDKIPKRDDDEIINLLLEKGVNPNTNFINKQNHYSTAFLEAILKDDISIKVIKNMIDKGADCRGENPDNCYNKLITPIDLTCSRSVADKSHKRIIRDNLITTLLLKNGANPNQIMNSGPTLVMLAIQDENLQLLKILQQHGADLLSPQSDPKQDPIAFAKDRLMEKRIIKKAQNSDPSDLEKRCEGIVSLLEKERQKKPSTGPSSPKLEEESKQTQI